MPEPISRRNMLGAAAAVLYTRTSSAAARKMKMCLNTGNIGVRANLQEAIAMAARHGFEAVDPNVRDLAALSDSAMGQLLDDLRSKNLEFGSVAQSFPVSQPDEKWADFIKELAASAKTLQRAGVRRFVTWLTSREEKLTYLQNFKLHTRRIGEAATVLGDHNVRLGLEYLGPKTMWGAGKYPFIHTMESMKELILAVGKSNLGFLLDSWHWYTAGDTVADVLTLKNQDIVAVHLNDAPAGVPTDQQVDSRREVPLATGLIDAAGFLNALNQVGYDGPVAAEPMNAALRALPPEDALARVSEAMHKAFALIKT